MYDTLTKNVEEERQDFNDRNKLGLQQTNQELCQDRKMGVTTEMFTLILMSLLRNDLRLRSNSYAQGSLYHRNSCRKLAWAI